VILPAPSTPPGGDFPERSYTPAMRRWVCVIALLYGFAGNGYAWSARPRIPVPIERSIDSGAAGREPTQMVAWWRRT
jgi:hypothetical protein